MAWRVRALGVRRGQLKAGGDPGEACPRGKLAGDLRGLSAVVARRGCGGEDGADKRAPLVSGRNARGVGDSG